MALSMAQRLALAPPAARDEWLQSLTVEQAAELLFDPEFKLRPDQLAAVRDQTYAQLLLCGRMWGKSETSSHWLAQRAMTEPGDYALVAPTADDAKLKEVEGPSGLLTAISPRHIQAHVESERVILLTNGSRIFYRGSDMRQGGLRGYNLRAAVVAEAAAMPTARLEELLWDHLLPALRIGTNPQILIVCTPKPVQWLRDMVLGKVNFDGELRVVRGRSEDNTAIARKVLRRLRSSMSARRARQELDAEVLLDVEGALWTDDLISRHRLLEPPTRTIRDRDGDRTVPDYRRVVVGVDPSGSTTGDEIGLVAAGLGPDGHGYVIADRTTEGLTPDGWARRALQLYLDTQADAIVVERNYGGDMAKHTIQVAADAMAREGKATRSVRIIEVTATRGKALRAEPVVALYENGRVHHVGPAHSDHPLARLEDQMTTWTPDSGYSPGRIDALVWALTALQLDPASQPAETSADSPLDW